MLLLKLTLVSLLFIYVSIQVMYLLRKRSMHKKEKDLESLGIGPFGSGLCHGMVLNEKDPKAVIRDSKKSHAWYSRLV